MDPRHKISCWVCSHTNEPHRATLGHLAIGFACRPTLGLCAIQALDHVGEKMRGGTNSPDCIPRAQMCLGANFPPQRQKIRATIYGHHPITERKLIADNAVLLGTRST